MLTSSLLSSEQAMAQAVVTLRDVQGNVKARPDAKSPWSPAKDGATLADDARVETASGASATLVFSDSTETKLSENSQIIVRTKRGGSATSGVVLFFGRLWAKVAQRGGAAGTFEVRSANAVAGVRGTEFQVGVADDGSTRVVVSEGTVSVGGDDEEKHLEVGGGYEVEGDGRGHLSGREKSKADLDWKGWFSARARKLEQQGIQVAKNLNGRLDRRRAKVEQLLKEQRALRKDIERLEAEKNAGKGVDRALRDKLSALERVTARLEDMRQRLDAAFGMFARWGSVAEKGGFPGAETLRAMAVDVEAIARDFADMIEEGTDMSEEGMDDMMDDMGKGKRDRPTKSAGDELFR